MLQGDGAELGAVARAVVLGADGVDQDDRAQVGELVLDGGDLGELVLVLADDRAGVGVGDHPQALLGGVGLVDGNHDEAGGGRGHVGVGPLGPRVGEDADPLAGLQAEVDQPEPDLLHDLGELRVGHVFPPAVSLVADRHMLGVHRG